MSVESYIGWRYLKAKRKQVFISLITLISLAGIALGVTALIVVLAVMSGFSTDLKNKILGVNSHLVILEAGQPMQDYRRLISQVEKTDQVVSVEPFIYSQVMINALGGVTGAVLRGLDPELARKHSYLAKSVTQGSLTSLEAKSPETGKPAAVILVGIELARQLGLQVGDQVKVISPLGDVTPLGGRAPRVKTFTVGGLFQSGMYEYDSTLVYLALEQAQDFLSLGRSVTGLEVKVKDIYQADKVKKKILAALGPDFRGRDWMQMNRTLFSALKLEKAAMFIILTLTVLVAAFNMISTLIMVVMEKNKDIAILKSMGATGRMVMKIFVFQGLLVGAAGTLAGLAAGTVLCRLLAHYKFIQLPSDVYYITTLPVRMEAWDVILVTVAAVGISLLATLYPAWQAARFKPVEALRYE